MLEASFENCLEGEGDLTVVISANLLHEMKIRPHLTDLSKVPFGSLKIPIAGDLWALPAAAAVYSGRPNFVVNVPIEKLSRLEIRQLAQQRRSFHLPGHTADIFSLKHESSIFISVIQPCMWFLHDITGLGSILFVPWMTGLALPKPHTGLDEWSEYATFVL